MTYKAVIFDLDGTLLDTTEGVVEAVKRTIEDNNLNMPDEAEIKKFVGPPMQKSMKEQFDLDDDRALSLANEFRTNYKNHSLFQAQLYDGIIELLRELKEKGYKIAVATNKSHQNAVDLLKKFAIDEYCDFMMGSDLEGKLSKTDILNTCIDKLEIEKKDAVLIGDSIFDLKGAELSGVDFIAVTYGFGFRRDETIESSNCKMIVNSVEALQNVLI